VHVTGPGVVGSLDQRINCDETCDRDSGCSRCATGEVYDDGERVQLTPYPEPGHPLTAVTGIPCGTERKECFVTFVGDLEVSFAFAP